MAVTKARWLRNPDGGEPTTLEAVIDDETLLVPADVNNRHFSEIKNAEFRREITIEPPDTEPEPPADDPYRNLTPAQFEWMLAYYDLEGIWSGVTADAKGQSKPMYANIRAQQKRQEYALDDTLGLLQQIRHQPKIANSGIDLSDDAIKGYWRHAAVQDFASMLAVVPEPPIPGTGETE